LTAKTVADPKTEDFHFKPMIAFDERINPSTVTNSTFTLNVTQSVTVPSTVTVAPDGLSAVLTPNQPLLPNTSYSANWASGIQDLAGNQLFNAGGATFTTGPVAIDTTVPTNLLFAGTVTLWCLLRSFCALRDRKHLLVAE
jgi:hypothetical protein